MSSPKHLHGGEPRWELGLLFCRTYLPVGTESSIAWSGNENIASSPNCWPPALADIDFYRQCLLSTYYSMRTVGCPPRLLIFWVLTVDQLLHIFIALTDG